MYATAMGFDSLSLKPYISGDVVVLAVVGAFYVNIGLYAFENTDCVGRVVHGDPVDAADAGAHLGAYGVGKDRPARSFVDKLIGGYRDAKNIALTAGLLEMPQMPHMQQVEHSV